jgi:hypothetical protein
MPVPTDTEETSASRVGQMDESSEWVQQQKRRTGGVSSTVDHSDGPAASTSHDAGGRTHPEQDVIHGTTTPPDERHPRPPEPQLVKVPLEPGQTPLELKSQIQVYATNELS